MKTTTIEQAAAVYIPAAWRQAIARGESLPERTGGAALFADISGFTPLTEALAQAMGLRRGAEELPRHLNQVYDALIIEVNRFGGSVIGFAGDAITCWFDGDDRASLRALACALSMQRAMGQFAAVPVPGQEPAPLAIKVAVASGSVRRFVVGDPGRQLIPALAGQTLARMAAAEHLAGRGEVVVDEATVDRAGARIQVVEWRIDEESGDRFALAGGLQGDVEPAPWPPLAPDALSEEQVRPWVLPSVYARLGAGLGEFLTELRPAVALFLRFAGIDYDGDPQAGEKLDAYVRWVQGIIDRYEGTLIQLTIGDKGSYLYAAFGAPIAHEDDARRAVLAALRLRTSPPDLAFVDQVQIGISRGTMRTGTYGGTARRTYGSLGDQVNLAARLMAFAEQGEVIVNQTVQRVVSDEFDWVLLPSIQVKGKGESIAVARLVGEATAGLPCQAHGGELVGRQAEVARMDEVLDTVAAGRSRVLIVQGQAGMGKSRLVSELSRLGIERGLDLLQGAGQSIEQHTPYRAWRGILTEVFGLGRLAIGQEDGAEHVRSLVEELVPAHVEHLPLLNDILNLGLPETERTAGLDPAQRRQALSEFILDLVQARAGARPLLLVLEDAQWLDSLSWALAGQVAGGVGPGAILLVVVARSLDQDALAQEYAALLKALPGTELLSLAPLSDEDNTAVAAARLGLLPEDLPAPVAGLVAGRTEGNPFFAEQLVLTLQEQGLIEIVSPEDGGERLCMVSGDLSQAGQTLPETVQGLVLARIDRLPPERQLILKIAAVIGRDFSYNPLSHTVKQHLPLSDTALSAHLGDLDARELILLDIPVPEMTYFFKYLTIQDIAYQTMSYAQRRRLHRDVARWYEGAYTADLSPLYALLAHHWSLAEDAARATHYLLLAGDEARRLYALPEAIDYYQRALVFLRQGEAYEQTARTLMKLGLTYHLAFDYGSARHAYQEGFALWQQAGEAQAATTLPPARHPFRADWPYLPLTLDPGLAGDIDTVGVLDQLYSGLVSLGAGLDVTPDVARSWEILDEGKKYVFYLRDDVHWSDGTPVTAADFEYAWKRVLDPATESPVASTLYDVKGARAYHQGGTSDPQIVGVRAGADGSLVVELEQPTSYFLYLMAFSASYPVPRHVVEAHGQEWTQPEKLVTNGPFRLESWEQKNDQDGVLALARYDGYHGRCAGNVQRVELRAHPAEAERLGAYEAGELDMLTFRNLSQDRDRVRQRHAGEYLSVPFLATTYLVLDVSRPPFDDIRVRQAFVLALDRAQHADVNLKGFSFPATGGFVPPGMPGHSAEIGLSFDPDRARYLLAQAGYGSNERFPEIEFLAGPDREPAMTFLAAQWQEHLGLRLEWQCLDWAAFVERLEANPPHIFLNIWVNDYPDPDNFLRASNAMQWSRWRDTTYRRLVESARSLTDQGRRIEMYHQADSILVEQAAIVPFNYWRSHFLIKPEVHRFPTSAIKWWYWKDIVMEVGS